MVLKSICIVRHGSREKYRDAKALDIATFSDTVEIPGLLSQVHRPDDPLTRIGKNQAHELARYLAEHHPEISIVYTSRHYRCLETVKPYVEMREHDENPVRVGLEIGLSEWQRSDRKTARAPSPGQLRKYYSSFDAEHQSLCQPLGHENLSEFYARNAYFLALLVQSLDNDPDAPESVLLCTSASNVVWLARILLGRLPEDPMEQDFEAPAIGFYKFVRHGMLPVEIDNTSKTPLGYPQVDWRNKVAIGGSWEMTHNADCNFLTSGNLMIWTPSDIPKYLPPSEALKMPKPNLPNFFDLHELRSEKLDAASEGVGKDIPSMVSSVEALAEG